MMKESYDEADKYFANAKRNESHHSNLSNNLNNFTKTKKPHMEELDAYTCLTEKQLREDLPDMIHTMFFTGREPMDACIIKGRAGTGKTTILKRIVSHLEALEIPTILMAPTGKAADVIGRKTNFEARTIHSCIYRPNEEATKKGYLHFLCKDNEDKDNTVYIVDESSLVNNVSTNYNGLHQNGTLTDLLKFVDCENSNRKIIFVGDPYQLLPVKDVNTSALDEVELKLAGVKVIAFELETVYRQKEDSVLTENIENFYQQITKPTGGYQNLVPGPEVNITTTDVIYNNFVASYLKNKAEVVMIAHSNNQVHQHNANIRNLFQYPERALQVGERLIICQNTYLQHFTLLNGQFIDVVNVGEEHLVSVNLQEDKFNKTVEIRLLKVMISIGDDERITGYILKDYLFSDLIGVQPEVQRALLVDFKLRMKKKDIHEDSDDYKSRMRTDEIYNAFFVKFGYCITCHKAQGGEWKNVFIDWHYKGPNKEEGFFRWAYTALSRASERVFVKLGGKMNTLTL